MKGVIAYVLSKKYTDDSLIGMGALKGANCKVKDVVKTDRTTTVTLSWKDDLDVDHDTDFEILDGLDGVDIVSATVSNTYHLILTLSDGNTIDAGVISDKVTTMPTASASNVGMINQFVGTTDSNYTHGYFYECIENEGVYSWQRIDVQPNIIESVNGQTGIVTLTAEDVGALPEDTVIPTKVSELENDSNFINEDDLATKQDIIQYETLPIASETLVGKIVQYIGNSTLNYRNGYFYQCVEDEVEEGQPQTYSWIAKSVQQGGGSGTSDYEELQNLPKVNDVTLIGNKTLSDLNIYSKDETDDLLDDKLSITQDVSDVGKVPMVNSDGELELSEVGGVYTAGSGIDITNNIISTKLDPSGAVHASSNGLNINTDDESVEITDNKLKAKIDQYGGLEITSDGIGVKAGNAIYVDDNGVNVITKANGGIVSDSQGSGLMVDIDDTTTSQYKLWSSSKINTTKLNSNQGSQNAGKFLKVGNDGGVIADVVPSGVEIDDATTSTGKVWSSNKVNTELNDKLDTDGEGKDVTVTFTEASDRSNINTTESLSTLFGKIKKYFTDLKTVAFSGLLSDLTEDTTHRVVTDAEKSTWNNKIDSTEKGANNGVAELGSDGKIPSSQLPSYVDDVLEYASVSNFPETGESGKIYIALDTNVTYRWGGSTYVIIGSSLALGETSSTAYRGDRGKTAYDHATDSNRLTTTTASGFYKFGVTNQGHISSVTSVTLSDITNLGAEASSNKVTSWSSTTTNTHYPSEKLVKDSLDGKVNILQGLENEGKILQVDASGDLALTNPLQIDDSGQPSNTKLWSSSKISSELGQKGSGTVTSITAGTGMTGGTITSSGTIGLKLVSTILSSLKAIGKGNTENREYAVGLDSGGDLSVNIPWTDTTYNVVDKSSNGLCPQLPNESTTTKYLRQDGSWQVPPNTTYSEATQQTAGLMSATDKTRLDVLYTQIPAPPQNDGNYLLQVSVNDGVATYSWVTSTVQWVEA